LKFLEELNLSYNQIREIDPAALQGLDSLEKLPYSHRNLDLSNNQISAVNISSFKDLVCGMWILSLINLNRKT